MPETLGREGDIAQMILYHLQREVAGLGGCWMDGHAGRVHPPSCPPPPPQQLEPTIMCTLGIAAIPSRVTEAMLMLRFPRMHITFGCRWIWKHVLGETMRPAVDPHIEITNIVLFFCHRIAQIVRCWHQHVCASKLNDQRC
jgi:hypothetical protein